MGLHGEPTPSWTTWKNWRCAATWQEHVKDLWMTMTCEKRKNEKFLIKFKCVSFERLCQKSVANIIINNKTM